MAIKIKLSSNNIQNVLENDSTIKKIVNERSADIEDSLKSVVSINNFSPENTKRKNFKKQNVNNSEGEKHDRFRKEVSVKPAFFSDFKNGTIQKAVENAKGRKK